MSIPHVCSAYRRRSLDQIRQTKPQWQLRATFISLSTPRGTTDKATAKLADIAETKNEVPLPIGGANPQVRRARKDSNRGDVLESLFEESIQFNPAPNRGPAPDSTAPHLQAYDRVDTLNQMMNHKENAWQCWQYFVQNLGPAVWMAEQNPINRPVMFSVVMQRLFKNVLDAKREGTIRPQDLSISELARIYAELGLLRHLDWMSMMWNILPEIYERNHAIQREGQSDLPKNEEDMLLLEDLIDLWAMFTASYNRPPRPNSIIQDFAVRRFDFVYSFGQNEVLQKKKSHGIDGAFGLLVPGCPRKATEGLAASAIVTFYVLSGLSLESEAQFEGSRKLLTGIASIIAAGRFVKPELQESLERQLSPEMAALITENWNTIFEKAVQLYSADSSPDGQHAKAQAFKEPRFNVGSRLSQAVKKRDIRRINELWKEAKALNLVLNRDSDAALPSESPVDSFGLDQILCNQFIVGYMSLRRMTEAIDVWNHMISVGLTPNVVSWNAMLEGCKLARDVPSLEGVWRKMLDSGILPDAVCWTTRISALVEDRRGEQGIKALDDMGRLWLAAVKKEHPALKSTSYASLGDVAGIAKPTIATINAVINSLIRRHQGESAYRILAWAGNLGINPDIFTYNILLRPLIRQGRTEDAQKLLKNMEAQGIRADIATYTTILDETLHPEATHTAEEQIAIIDNIFNEMKLANIEANMHTYGRLVYNLLQSRPKNGDLSAVKAVLDRMATQGLQPSPHIHTMILEHHFTRSPPDLLAARALIDRINSTGGATDHIFWDRVIESFSRAGDITTALRILGKVQRNGEHVHWHSFNALVTALMENGQEEVARKVVADVYRDKGGPLGENDRGKEGQHLFWAVVAEYGLLAQ
jgi:pentatricopeptide repeat protein